MFTYSEWLCASLRHISVYEQVVYGQPRASARWQECESYVTYQMRMAIGQKFVKQAFDETAKDTVSKFRYSLII